MRQPIRGERKCRSPVSRSPRTRWASPRGRRRHDRRRRADAGPRRRDEAPARRSGGDRCSGRVGIRFLCHLRLPQQDCRRTGLEARREARRPARPGPSPGQGCGEPGRLADVRQDRHLPGDRFRIGGVPGGSVRDGQGAAWRRAGGSAHVRAGIRGGAVPASLGRRSDRTSRTQLLNRIFISGPSMGNEGPGYHGSNPGAPRLIAVAKRIFMKVEAQQAPAEPVEAEKEQRPVLLPWLTALFLGSAALGLFFLISPALTGERYYKVGFHANPQMYARQILLLFIPYAFALRAWRKGARVPMYLLLGGAILLHLIVLFAPPPQSQDFYQYLFYGRMQAVHGANPYVDLPSKFWADSWIPWTRWHNQTSVYGPVWMLITWGVVKTAGNSMTLAFVELKLVILA